MRVQTNNINLLVTLSAAYLPHLNAFLTSIIYHNSETYLTVYLLHTSITETDVIPTNTVLEGYGKLILIEATDHGLNNAPTTKQFPREMYYRIFAAKYLLDTVDRVLYPDSDIIVNGSLKELYDKVTADLGM